MLNLQRQAKVFLLVAPMLGVGLPLASLQADEPPVPGAEMRQDVNAAITSLVEPSSSRRMPPVVSKTTVKVHSTTENRSTTDGSADSRPTIRKKMSKRSEDKNQQRSSDPTRTLVRLLSITSVGAAFFFAIYLYRQNAVPSGDIGNADLVVTSNLRFAPRCCLTLVRAHDSSFLVARDAAGIKYVLPVEKSFDKYLDSRARQ